jgi:zinc D-Ala-D-Ala carboxypeptidase
LELLLATLLDQDEQLSPHFKLSEFRCPCCGDVIRDNAKLLALRLEPVRADVGPVIITSAFRCPRHNQAVGGSQFSQHLTGLAADIFVTDDRHRFLLVKSLIAHRFRRLGVKASMVHADAGHDSLDVLWLYA